MSKIKIQGHSSGTGILTISAPNTSTDRTVTIPDSSGTLLDENSSVPAANLTGTIADARFPATLPAKSAANLTNIPAANITGTLPAIDGSNLTGLVATLSGLTDATVSASDPTESTNPSAVGHLWVNSTSGEAYICTSATNNANVWINIGTGTGDMPPMTGSGGTVTTVGSYTVHTFTSSANFVVTGSSGSVDYFMIAGGGGGAGWSGGGGGAGGYISGTLTATPQTYSIVIGSGGAGGVHMAAGADGVDTTGLGQTAVGGGGGGFSEQDPARSGGSGGGGAATPAPGGQPGAGTAGQGYAGGHGAGTEHPWGHGGGGGASDVGNNGSWNTPRSGEGGAGIQNNLDGNNYYYGGGGGGGAHNTNNGSEIGWSFGGIGGGGGGSGNETSGTGGGSARNAGASPSNDSDGGAGGANTGGGGGGGAGGGTTGGVGGSGIMIIRYLT